MTKIKQTLSKVNNFSTELIFLISYIILIYLKILGKFIKFNKKGIHITTKKINIIIKYTKIIDLAIDLVISFLTIPPFCKVIINRIKKIIFNYIDKKLGD